MSQELHVHPRALTEKTLVMLSLIQDKVVFTLLGDLYMITFTGSNTNRAL